MRKTSKPIHGDNQASPGAVLDEKAAASYVGLATKTLQMRRATHQAPAFLKIGRSIRYRLVDLDAFLSAHRVDPEARV